VPAQASQLQGRSNPEIPPWAKMSDRNPILQQTNIFPQNEGSYQTISSNQPSPYPHSSNQSLPSVAGDEQMQVIDKQIKLGRVI